MLDFLRNAGQTVEEKRYEAISAYVDGALTAAERARFEAEMANDATLRAEVERLQIMRQQLRAMPHRRVPRSYSLDPSMFGAPRAQPLVQLYPVLRGVTAATAFVFAIVLGLGLLQGGLFAPGQPVASEAAEVAMEPVAAVETAAESAAAESAAAESVESGQFSTEEVTPVEGPRVESAEQAADAAPALELEAAAVAPEEAPAAGLAAAGAVEAPTGGPELREMPTETANIDEGLEDASGGAEALPPDAASGGEAAAEETTQPVAQTTVPWLAPLAVSLGIALLALLLLTFLVRRRIL
jgi:hypothetical protein